MISMNESESSEQEITTKAQQLLILLTQHWRSCCLDVIQTHRRSTGVVAVTLLPSSGCNSSLHITSSITAAERCCYFFHTLLLLPLAAPILLMILLLTGCMCDYKDLNIVELLTELNQNQLSLNSRIRYKKYLCSKSCNTVSQVINANCVVFL